MAVVLTVAQVVEAIRGFAPEELQASWDNSGLQSGSCHWPVHKVLFCMDPLPQVLDYALAHQFDLVVSHHPLLFGKVKTIDTDTAVGQVLAMALKNEIAIYSVHTNLDVVSGGIGDCLAERLGLENTTILESTGRLVKLVVFVPQSHVDKVRQDIGTAGAGSIGNYSHCSFVTPGTGAFMPGMGTQPFVGTPGQLETVPEMRLETIVPAHKLRQVLAAMEESHPYQEVAYDLLPTENHSPEGFGRIGQLAQPLTLADFTRLCADRLGCSHLRIAGDPNKLVSRVAVCGGSGDDFVGLALKHKADVNVAGDISYHKALTALAGGMAIIDPGHYKSELVGLEVLKSVMAKQFSNALHCEIFPVNMDPFRTFVASSAGEGNVQWNT